MERQESPIDAAACAWVAAEDRGLAAAQRRERDDWLAADSRHFGAYARASAAWRLVSANAATGDVGRDTAPPWMAAGLLPRRALLGGGGALLAAGVAAFLIGGRSRGTVYETMVGEVRRIPLADGSSIVMNTGSRLSARLAEAGRTIDLARGEAFFDVAKDPRRPFVVRAAGVEVRALGTAFSVRLQGSRVTTLVTEGTVLVSRGDERETARAGHAVAWAVGKPAGLTDVDEAELDRHLAWRTGIVSFDGETLEQAVAEFNRYGGRAVTIADPRIARAPVVGRFRIQDTRGFARAVGAVLAVPVATDGDAIVIGAAPALTEPS